MATKKKKAPSAAAKKAAPVKRSDQVGYDAALKEFAEAVQLLHKGDFDEARQRFEAIMKAVPHEAELTDRARTYASICVRRLETAPGTPESSEELYYLGVVQSNEGLLDEAVDTLTRALAMEPESARALYARSVTRALQRRTDDAVADLRNAVAMDPKVRFQAVNDSDFDGIRDEAAFIDIVEPTPSEVLNVATQREPVSVVVLAAGLGKRMRSKRIKLLHPVAGRPMLIWLLEACRAIRPRRIVTVVGHQSDSVMDAAAGSCDQFVLQREQRGTGHAVLQALPKMEFPKRGQLLIVNGDLPTLRPSTLRALLSRHRRTGATMTVLTSRLEDPTGYGRVLREAHGRVARIVEDRDADKEQKRVREVNCGIYCADPHKLLLVLRKLRPDNVQGEYYLTDAVHRLLEIGDKVLAVCHNDAEEVLGVNDRAELARAGRTLYARKTRELQVAGVTILDPSRTWVDPRARIGRDTVLYPDVQIEGTCVLGEDCVVRSGSRIKDSRLAAGVEIRDHSVVLESVLAEGVQVGPFAHLRPGTRLDDGVRVGNFVEVKKSRLRPGVKASHLSYLGDADIGAGSNIGAGTITCNYDGEHKHPTVLGKGVFVGSDTQLVAPVRVGDGAYIGAGSTVTEDVPPGALAISRSRQRNIEGWTKRRAGGGKKKPKESRSDKAS